MNIRHYIFIILFILPATQLIAQNPVLFGKAIDYSGKELIFYLIQEPILNQKLELATTRVANDGTFSVTVPVDQTNEIYVDLEKYCGTMVVEPGKNYQIVLPPFTPKTSFEANSAYFKPIPYWLGLPGTDNNDLNFSVRSFITEFNLETGKNTFPIYQQKSKEVVNEIIERLEKKYSTIYNPYFKILKKYYFADLEYAVNQRTPDYIIHKYFADQPVSLSHPVYRSAFENQFTDFLRKQAQNIQNNKIVSITNSGNYTELVKLFEGKGYARAFAELVVLKGLYDGYYTGSFSKEGVIKAIEKAQTATASPQLLPIAQQIKAKLTLLAVGGKAPAFKLYNLKKEVVSPDLFHGKFVYLSFFNSKSSDCKTELDSIVSLEKQLRQVLSIVSIAIDDNFENAVKVWKTKGYSWELLDGSKQKQLIINYNASIAPAFYLIAPDGNLGLSPAPAPTQGFKPLFLKFLRDYNFKNKPTGINRKQ